MIHIGILELVCPLIDGQVSLKLTSKVRDYRSESALIIEQIITSSHQLHRCKKVY